MEVSLLAAFVAGTISFLSPCVLPLVPGYISMLSGIGVEQLQQGEQPRARLFASSLAFVSGFSVVFITFGASASAVGQFLVRNKSLLAPFAGAVIILFGLHLIKSGALEAELSSHLVEGLDERLAADYDPNVQVSEVEARDQCRRAAAFVERIRQYLTAQGLAMEEPDA